ncbi:MAG: hypothetical protein HQL22_02820 [Candidatus Omnitrophica bacterium]|nr:hypothetical protein [Candidatus Omnitrophota bacterium]
MTPKELLATKILDGVFPLLIFPTKNSRESWKLKIAEYIAEQYNHFLTRKLPNNIPDPVRKYKTLLEQDIKKLRQLKTHKAQTAHILRLLEIKSEVCCQYLHLFRQKTSERFTVKLFLMTVNNLLWPLGYELRRGVLSELLLLSTTTNIKYAHWQEAVKKTHLQNRLELSIQSTEKMLHRIVNDSKSYHKDYREEPIPFLSISSLKTFPIETIPDDILLPTPTFATDRLPTLPDGVVHKNFQRYKIIQRHLENELSTYTKNFIELDPTKLRIILKEIKIQNSDEMLQELLNDSEFLAAFRMPL